MSEMRTTYAVQCYLDQLAGGSSAGPVVRDLLARAVDRLHHLCAALLHRGYPRLARPPLGLHADELLGAVVELLLKALDDARPATVRQFFALANRHIRWELNDLARRLARQAVPADVCPDAVAAPASSGGELGPDARRILDAIDALPEDEREALSLVRVQGLTQPEAAALLGVSEKTVQRRLTRALVLLADRLGDLRPCPSPAR